MAHALQQGILCCAVVRMHILHRSLSAHFAPLAGAAMCKTFSVAGAGKAQILPNHSHAESADMQQHNTSCMLDPLGLDSAVHSEHSF